MPASRGPLGGIDCVRRLIAAFAAILLAIFAVHATGATSAAMSPTGVEHAYDGHHPSAPDSYNITERGPPTVDDEYAADDADGPWSRGVSARPAEETSGTTTARPTSAEFVQAAGPTGMNLARGHAAFGHPSSLERSDVAANAVRPSVTDARLGRALADDFRGGPNPIGDGSALDAARHTVDTGQLVGGSTHLEKPVEMRDRYARVLRCGGLRSADEAVAQGRYDAYSSFVIENDLDAMMRARGLR